MGEQNTSFLLDGDNIVAETRGGCLINRYIYGVNLVFWRSGSSLLYGSVKNFSHFGLQTLA